MKVHKILWTLIFVWSNKSLVCEGESKRVSMSILCEGWVGDQTKVTSVKGGGTNNLLCRGGWVNKSLLSEGWMGEPTNVKCVKAG